MFVEEGAGMNAQFKDSDYLEAGAQVKPLKEMYNNSDIIIKVYTVSATQYFARIYCMYVVS